jgi:hypothetical protein
VYVSFLLLLFALFYFSWTALVLLLCVSHEIKDVSLTFLDKKINLCFFLLCPPTQPNNSFTIYGENLESAVGACTPDETSISVNTEYHLKFEITTMTDNNEPYVELRAYIQNTNGWVVAFEFNDTQGSWPAVNDSDTTYEDPITNTVYTDATAFLAGVCNDPLTNTYPHKSGDPVFDSGNVVFLRGGPCDDTLTTWTDVSVLNEHTPCSNDGAVCLSPDDCCDGYDTNGEYWPGVCVRGDSFQANEYGFCNQTLPSQRYYGSMNGGDPHFSRWQHHRETFHGECDLVMIHASNFDLQVRTTIESFFSYIEAAALRIGDLVLEVQKDAFYVNGVMLTYDDALPFSSGGIDIVQTRKETNKQVYKVSFLKSSIEYHYYKQFLTLKVNADTGDFYQATGLLGKFPSGDMYNRDGERTEDIAFGMHAFEWQVAPDDVHLFREDRAPQLPFETCRLPTAAAPSRRRLRADSTLMQQAEEVCAPLHKNDFQLCVDDVVMTGDIGLAYEWL